MHAWPVQTYSDGDARVLVFRAISWSEVYKISNIDKAGSDLRGRRGWGRGRLV